MGILQVVSANTDLLPSLFRGLPSAIRAGWLSVPVTPIPDSTIVSICLNLAGACTVLPESLGQPPRDRLVDRETTIRGVTGCDLRARTW